MLRAGIDIGSRTIKLVVTESNKVVMSRHCENSFNTIGDCYKLLEGVEYDSITATGYGRYLFADHFPQAGVVTEIKAFAVGAHSLYPDSSLILDIGGQDTKAISLDEKGAIRKFEMNDKCAAGTGRFLEVMAMTLRYTLDEFGSEAMRSTVVEKINSMCTVFAESEVVSMLSRGTQREDIAKAILQSVVARATSLLRKVEPIGGRGAVVFVGGVAKNSAMLSLLSQSIGREVLSPPFPQLVGAYGASLVSEK